MGDSEPSERTESEERSDTVTVASGATAARTRGSSVIRIVAVAAVVLLLVAVFELALCGVPPGFQSQPQLDVVAALVPRDATTWNLRGRVLRDGEPAGGARVWVVLRDGRGNRASPSAAITDAEGGFGIEPVPRTLSETVTEATVYARKPCSLSFLTSMNTSVFGQHEGEVALLAPERAALPWQTIVWPLIAVGVAFFVGLLVPFASSKFDKQKYALSLLAAFFLTVVMFVLTSVGLTAVNISNERDSPRSLGVAWIFHGTYVERVPPDWLFSLTAPRGAPRKGESRQGGPPGRAESRNDAGAVLPAGAPEAAASSELVQGFGAPLWIVFMAVLGAGLTTISIILREIREKPKFENHDDVQKHLEVFARHQLFIVFSPLGAVFVYQLLVLTKSASEPFTVALAALGAGFSLTALLDVAMKKIQELFGGRSKANGTAPAGAVKKDVS